MDVLAVPDRSAATDIGLRVDHEGQGHRILDGLHRDAPSLRHQTALGLAERPAPGPDASSEDEEVGPVASLGPKSPRR